MPVGAWVPAKNVTMTIAGQIQPATDCEYQHEIGAWDATNLTSGGDYESGVDIKKRTIRGTIVVDSGVVPVIALGTIVAASYTATGGLSHSGNLRILNWTEKGGPKGGYLVSFQGEGTGPWTNS